MDRWLAAAGVLMILLAVSAVFFNRLYLNKIMDTMEEMIHQAVCGDFCAENFDETRLSKLELELSHFLGAAMVSAQNVAAERDRIKTLISDISHQTKTPVANLILYSELLGDAEIPKDQKCNVEVIREQAEKLRFLIDSLIKLSRLENGILTFSVQKISVNLLLRELYEQMMPKAEEKGLALELEPVPEQAAVAADRKWTFEALCNILDNAVKYTYHGQIRMSVKIYEMFVRIDICDTGIGIAEEEQAKIFLRFYRSEITKQAEGVGIGLFLAREIISGEGGYIKVESAAGSGSTFSVYLPKSYNSDRM